MKPLFEEFRKLQLVFSVEPCITDAGHAAMKDEQSHSTFRKCLWRTGKFGLSDSQKVSAVDNTGNESAKSSTVNTTPMPPANFPRRFSSHKGYTLFVQAMLLAMKEHPALQAVIVGGAPDEEKAVLEQLQRDLELAGMSDRFHWLGELPPKDMESVFCAMDLLVHTSVTPEPFGRILLEAMSQGVPVLSSSKGGPREIISHEQDGLLSDACERALAEQISRVIKSPQLRRKLGEAGRLTVQNRFHEDVCTLPILECLSALSFL